MSLNWKEINLILEELDLEGYKIQKIVQNAYEILSLRLYGKGRLKNLLVCLSPGACRLHETYSTMEKSDKPLRFAEFLNSRIQNSRIEEIVQLGEDRIVKIKLRLSTGSPDTEGELNYLYLRLWSNAANVLLTDPDGTVLDAMRRIPKKREISGGFYKPEETIVNRDKESITYKKEYEIRSFNDHVFPGESRIDENSSFNKKIDEYYKRETGSLSLEVLHEAARKKYEINKNRLSSSINKLREKEKEFSRAEQFREYGDLLLSNLNKISKGDEWFETDNIRIKLNSKKPPSLQAEEYYTQYRKAKSGIQEIKKEIEEEENELKKLDDWLNKLLELKDPVKLQKQINRNTLNEKQPPLHILNLKRPGISYLHNEWQIFVGRDAAENDSLLRKHVNGNDLWLHARDFPGSYVFIKYRKGKSIPLEILLDAGNLALFYSKGRNKGEGDLFYTQVKYLRRAKKTSSGKPGKKPAALVIPTQEKNLYIKLEEKRLKNLESSRLSV